MFLLHRDSTKKRPGFTEKDDLGRKGFNRKGHQEGARIAKKFYN